jgi:hypothetical protein
MHTMLSDGVATARFRSEDAQHVGIRIVQRSSRDRQETELPVAGAELGGQVQRSSGMPTDMPLTPDKALLSYSLKKRRALDR